LEAVFGVFTTFLVAAIPLAVGVTKAVDLVRSLADPTARLPKATWIVAGFVGGLGLALGWQFNLVSTLSHAVPALADSSRFDGVTGQILTGLAIGGMSSFWHEKLDQWSGTAKVNHHLAGGRPEGEPAYEPGDPRTVNVDS
jgi:hypothetical protein